VARFLPQAVIPFGHPYFRGHFGPGGDGFYIQNRRPVQGIQPFYPEDILSALQQLHLSQADGIGTILSSGGKNSHQGKIRTGFGVDFQPPPPGPGRGPADPEKNQQVRILLNPFQSFLVSGRKNDLGNDRFPPLPSFLPDGVMNFSDGFEDYVRQNTPMIGGMTGR
jgi:hypothetical protein